MRITLHIGLEKTGSSSIQQFLFANREALMRRGVLTPHAAGRDVHVEVLMAAMDDDNIDNVRVMTARVDPARLAARRAIFADRLAREIDAARPDHVLLSDERLSSRLFSETEVRRLAAFLGHFSDDVRVLVYLRDQATLLPTFHATNVMYGETAPLRFTPPEPGEDVAAAWRRRRDTYLRMHPGAPFVFDPLPFWFDFQSVIALWRAGFGDSAVTVRLFHRKTLANGDVIDDFAEATGLGDIGDLQRVGWENPAPGAAALAVMRLYNRAFPPIVNGRRNRLRRMGLMRALQRLPGARTRLDDAERARITALFADSNAAVARNVFHREPPLFPG